VSPFLPTLEKNFGNSAVNLQKARKKMIGRTISHYHGGGRIRLSLDKIIEKLPSAELRTDPSTGLRTGPSTELRTGPSAELRAGPSTGLRTIGGGGRVCGL